MRLTESALALVHFTVHTDPRGTDPDRPLPGDTGELQDELAEAIRTWDDRLASLPGSRDVAELLDRGPRGVQGGGRPGAGAGRPARDRRPERRRRLQRAALRPSGGQEERFTLYLAGAPATLTAVLPLLQRLGAGGARRATVGDRPARRPALLDLRLRAAPGRRHPGRRGRPAARRGRRGSSPRRSAAAWRGEAETDGFSALVLRAGLSWREVAVLRAYARYARQLGNRYGVAYLADTLLAHPDGGRALLAPVHRGSIRRSTRRCGTRPRTTRWRGPRVDRRGDRAGRRPDPAQLPRHDRCDPAHQLLPRAPVPVVQDRPGRRCRTCPPPGPGSRSSSTPRGSRACTCATAPSPAAACAGRTGRRTSAPRSSAWSRPRR